MKKPMLRFVVGAVIVITGIIVAGCSGLPGDLKKQANAVPDTISEARANVEKLEGSFANLKGTGEYDFFRPYDERENWNDFYGQARAKLTDAEAVYTNSLKPAVDRNNPEEEEFVRSQLDRINLARREALDLGRTPGNRMEFLREVSESAPQMVEIAATQMAAMTVSYRGLEAMLNKAREDYPQKNEDLVSRFAPLRDLHVQSQGSLGTAQTEFASSTPDYARLGDSVTTVKDNGEKFVQEGEGLSAKVGELGRSYNRQLVDMKSDFYVTVGRTSWNESSDWPSEHDYRYAPRQVDGPTYEYFASLTQDTLARGRNVQVDRNMWNALQVNLTEDWPSRSDNASQHWLADSNVRYFHKYIETESEVRTETDWIEVDEGVYEANLNNLGMDIISKPFGAYEEEALSEASPPGMSYVGNQRYGEWRRDDRGNSFWHWYGQYAFFSMMFGGPRPYYYYRNDWNTWNSGYRGRRPYYGPSDDPGRYGTSSSRTRQQYSGSTFARTGGFRAQDSSVRGAGARTRSGGPGRGGK